MNNLRILRARIAFPLLGTLAFFIISLSACEPSVSVAPNLIVAIDEAFAEMRPGLSKALEAPPLRAKGERRIDISLVLGPALVVERLAALPPEKKPTTIVVSPLLARILLANALRSADSTQGAAAPRNDQEPNAARIEGARLVALEWAGPIPGSLSTVRSDYRAAYSRAGTAAGSYIAALRAIDAPGATGGIIFLESPSRTRDLVDAFSSAYASALGGEALVKFLPLGPSGESPTNADAEYAVKSLLESDLRILFIAAGPASPAAFRAATGPGRAIGIEASEGGDLKKAADFFIGPDDKALAAALSELALISDVKKINIDVPARLEASKSAKTLSVGGKTLTDYLESAAQKNMP